MADADRQSPGRRFDPLIPILGSAVTLVCLGAVLLVFLPRVRAIVEADQGAVTRTLPPEEGKIPTWVCRSVDGVALLLEPLELSGVTTDKALDSVFKVGAHRYLRLSVYNFGRVDAYRLELPGKGFDSPEGGARLVPCASLIPDDISPAARTTALGLGAVPVLRVAPGHHARALLAAADKNLSERTAFVTGGLTFERREIPRIVLAQFHLSPALRTFQDF